MSGVRLVLAVRPVSSSTCQYLDREPMSQPHTSTPSGPGLFMSLIPRYLPQTDWTRRHCIGHVVGITATAETTLLNSRLRSMHLEAMVINIYVFSDNGWRPEKAPSNVRYLPIYLSLCRRRLQNLVPTSYLGSLLYHRPPQFRPRQRPSSNNSKTTGYRLPSTSTRASYLPRCRPRTPASRFPPTNPPSPRSSPPPAPLSQSPDQSPDPTPQ